MSCTPVGFCHLYHGSVPLRPWTFATPPMDLCHSDHGPLPLPSWTFPTPTMDLWAGGHGRSLLCYMASSLRVHITIEQPLNSMLYCMPCLAAALDISGARRVVSCIGAFNALSRKPLELYTTWDEDKDHIYKRGQKEADQHVKESLLAVANLAPSKTMHNIICLWFCLRTCFVYRGEGLWG